ncbi:DUF1176 domain-containing protein [Intestinirhabdus alba]|jgi:hypothetical protein|uniref:DUF1176 domain-containing protein n=1 Tax=Intestinirhabdus alba TaxID=2899544 RepID=A0A6L6IMJ7_9ENTR|nr:DUF1176 domain-containing protein [Intestinirhabdus alba]MTH47107.1 DUF1176 domain-containing protein [Intestinirhabdus alba]
MRLLPCALAAIFFSAPLFAAPLSGFSFAHKDWEVVCDNTGTCRAAGYGTHTGEVSVLLTRRAGPGQEVKGVVTFAQTQAPLQNGARVELFIDDRSNKTLTAKDAEHFRFDHRQLSALIQALTHDRKIEISLNGERKTLSSAGANAVFLKIDEYQQRIGTRNALLRKGEAGDEHVLQASPAPVILTAPVILSADESPLTPEQRQKIAPKIAAQSAECEDLENPPQLTLTRLDKTHSLLKGMCWRAAYNMGYALWLVDNGLSATPQLVTTDAIHYADGKITFYNKGRGMADCVSGEEWVWDGKSFVRSLAYRTGDCREITSGGTWMLPEFVSRTEPRNAKETDATALKLLQYAITEQQKTTPQLDLHKIIEQFPLTGQITAFDLSYAEGSPQPATKPSDDISNDEWLAFSQSAISAESEHGQVSFVLVDLDNDGKRDLIINSYAGGTGLFSYTGVLRRSGGKFLPVVEDNDDFGVTGALFSENGRGANQWGQWVRINGQVYALWFNGVFGEDNVYLLRPFSADDKVPVITIRYRYAFNTIDTAQEEYAALPALNEKDKSALLKTLETMQDRLLKDLPPDQPATAICPIPKGTSAEEAERYYSGVAGHYTIETVALIPVWLHEQCYIGTVFSHYGFYSAGVDATVVLKSPREEEDIIGSYAISGLRYVSSIKSSRAYREGDNGVM